jgi:hypothetical protein
MRRLIAAMVLLAAACPSAAAEVLREFAGPEAAVEGRPGAKTTAEVLVIEHPPVTRAMYAVRGTVLWEGVEGKAFIEMWSHFAGGGRYFSRTLAPSGPMGSLTGSGGPRAFVVPFSSGAEAKRPEKLVVNVVLPGRGTVRLSDLQLVQYEPGEDPAAVGGAWWSEQHGGLIGGIFGGLIGCMGAVIGVLAGRGQGRRFVLAALKVMITVGAAAVVAGVVAVASSQPYGVYYPLFLLGGLLVILPAGLLRVVRRRYEQLELRRMQAADV